MKYIFGNLMMTSRTSCIVALSVAILSLTGCGDNLATVKGQVTFNGEPVSRGFINLEPVDGKGTVSGASIEEGKFLMEDVVPGEKIVRLSAVYTKGIEKNAEDGSEIEICEDLFPPDYGKGKNLRLKVELPETKADYNVEGPDPRKKK